MNSNTERVGEVGLHEAETPFERYAGEVVHDGMDLMDRNNGPESKAPKEFHVVEHPKGMIERIQPMAKSLGMSPEQVALAEMAISYHDTIIEFDPPADGQLVGLAGQIKRHRGARAGDLPTGAEGNEAKSADALEARMRDATGDDGAMIFSEEEIKHARLAIDATYPDPMLGADFKGQIFEQFPHYKEIIADNPPVAEMVRIAAAAGFDRGAIFTQPHLDNMIENGEAIPAEVLVVALADLGESGAESFAIYKKGGNAEFRELHANLSNQETLTRLADGDTEQDTEDREKVVKEFVNWLGLQVGFVVGQMIRFNKNMLVMRNKGLISKEAEAGLRAQFSKFEENIHQSIDRRSEMVGLVEGKESDKAIFATVAQDMGYEIREALQLQAAA